MPKRNITADISERMALLMGDLQKVTRRQAGLAEEQRSIEERIAALRVTLEWERTLQGTTATVAASQNGRWLGVGVRDAVLQLRDEKPNWGFKEIRDHLIESGFDFKGKRPGNAVGIVLMRMKRTESSGESKH